MATMSHEPSHGVEKPAWSLQLRVTEMWASLAIIAMWLSVMFAAIYGPDIVTTSGSGATTSTVPSAVVLGLFAFFATWVVARYGFRHEKEH